MREETLRTFSLTLMLGAGCLEQGDENVSHPTLARWKDRLELRADVLRAPDGGVRAAVMLAPRFDSDVEDECPHFTLRATINGEPAKVERKLSIGRGFHVFCHMPSIVVPFDPALIVERQQTRFPEPGFDPDVITRFDVELSDASGRYAYKFGRDLPPSIEGHLVREQTGALQAGERVELVFDPPPRSTATAYLRNQGLQYWWLYPADSPPTSRPGEVQFGQVDGFEQTPSGYAFQLPELEPDTTELAVDVWPWSELLECPFSHCELGGDVMPFSTPVSVTVELPLE